MKRYKEYKSQDSNKNLKLDELTFTNPLSSDVFSNIVVPMVGASCEVISDNGNRCYETFSFTNIKNRNNDCSKYCLNHTNVWLNSLFDNKYFIELQGQHLFITNPSYESKIDKIELYIKSKIKLPKNKNIFKTTDDIYYYIQNLDYNEYRIFIFNNYDNYKRYINRYNRNKLINEEKISVENYLYELFKTNELNIVYYIRLSFQGDIMPNMTNVIVKYKTTNKISKNWVIQDNDIIKYLYKIEIPDDD